MRNDRGFTLIEILVSIAIFAMIVIGAMGVLGAADVGGFLEGFPTGVVTARVARDTTAASVFLQAFQEYAATKGGSQLNPGYYCEGPDCSPVVDIDLSLLTGHPLPPGEAYQLDWRKLEVIIERWYWDDTNKRYVCAEPVTPPSSCTFAIPFPLPESLVRVKTMLTWRFGDPDRSTPGIVEDCATPPLPGGCRTITVERFLP